jgi:hypothetical protein
MNDLANTLFLLRLVKLVLEVAGLSLIGLGFLWVMIRAVGGNPDTNFAYRVLQVVVSPFVRLVRAITPKFVPDRQVPWAALGLLVVAWGWVSFLAIPNACHSHGIPIAACLEIR